MFTLSDTIVVLIGNLISFIISKKRVKHNFVEIYKYSHAKY